MWGDPERAVKLDNSDALATILLQITGPAHVPWQDPRWQELLHGYNVWVHVEAHNSVLQQAGRACTQYAPRTSNLAALAMHVTRMLRELVHVTGTRGGATTTPSTDSDDAVSVFSNRIAVVGKARAAAGALNVLRILSHAVIVEQCSSKRLRSAQQATTPNTTTEPSYLEEVFLYQARGDAMHVQDAAHDLMDALLCFACQDNLERTPELYDTLVLALQLVLVLLSTQLYQPLVSSFSRHLAAAGEAESAPLSTHFFWEKLWQQARRRRTNHNHAASWTPRSCVETLLRYCMQRPAAPDRNSIASHNATLARSVALAQGEKVGPDGLHENIHVVVDAAASAASKVKPDYHDDQIAAQPPGSNSTSRVALRRPAAATSNVFLDATKGVLVISSSIILLPWRLLSLAYGLWEHSREKGYDSAHRRQLASNMSSSRRTKDVLWLSNSPVADLSGSLLLLLLNSERAGHHVSNPFRIVVQSLTDNRWEADGGLPDLPAPSHVADQIAPLLIPTLPPPPPSPTPSDPNVDALSINFEALFEAFGAVTHSEPGAFLLYTILQTAPSFADAVAVRSDLDTLILPLLRTLYFASSTRHFAAQDFNAKTRRRPSNESAPVPNAALSIRNCPFRSPSQLYLIVILLLLFSQDASFGSDAFRRIVVPHIVWYKERNLRDISLGSIMLLCLLRSLTFNLNRLHDAFLLSNCCAVLMNLAPDIVELHEYAAMRLVSVLVSSMKRHTVLAQQESIDEDDMTSLAALQAEVARTLLRVVKTSLSAKTIERNLYLVYSLVYHQTDLKRVLVMEHSPYRKSETGRIQKVIETAHDIIEADGNARTAVKALKVLAEDMDKIKEVVQERRKKGNDKEDFTFTYEEEQDPEVFFVPYLWEVIVCVVTASCLEWSKNRIRLFPLLQEETSDTDTAETAAVTLSEFSKDVSDVV